MEAKEKEVIAQLIALNEALIRIEIVEDLLMRTSRICQLSPFCRVFPLQLRRTWHGEF
jgi:hypothetical protein